MVRFVIGGYVVELEGRVEVDQQLGGLVYRRVVVPTRFERVLQPE